MREIRPQPLPIIALLLLALGAWPEATSGAAAASRPAPARPDGPARGAGAAGDFAQTLIRYRNASAVRFPARAPALREVLQNQFDDRFLGLFPSLEVFEQWLNSTSPEVEREAIAQILAELPEATPLQAQFAGLSAGEDRGAWLGLYDRCFDALKAHRLSRCPPIAFIERQPHISGTNAIYFATVHIQGSSIQVLDRPGAAPRTILQTRTGCVFDLSPSYDGQKLVFTYREQPREPFHLFEIGVDGKNLRQLTSGPYHDFNPVYYPDGRIVFSSSRVEAYSMCQNFLASALFICAADGSDVRRIDYTTLASSSPGILPDGTIAFTRWEYNDKNIFAWQGLWTIRPDGRNLRTLYGNTLIVPNSRFGPRPVPGTASKVVFTMAAHHHQPIGEIALVDPQRGAENGAALQRLTWATHWKVAQGETWRDTRWGPGDTYFRWGWTTPWPISKDVSLASFGGQYDSGPRRFSLYLLGHNARPLRLHTQAGTSLLGPVSLAPRDVPPALPGSAPARPGGMGTFYVADVYQGLAERGVARGQVKELRIWEQLPKKYNTEGPRLLDEYPVIGFGTYYVKKLHGSVPVEADGSAYFQAPAGVELYFQAVDEHGKEVRRMGSVTQITAGERAACVGCHEGRHTAPPTTTHASRRLQTPPSTIAPPSWGAGTIDYAALVQPVLDRYCVSCHNSARADGNVNLSGDKTRFFSVSYETLCRNRWIEYYHLNGGPTGVFPALSTGSWASRLTRLIEDRHAQVDVDAEGRKRLYAWIDANVPYYGTWDMDRPHTTGGHDVAQRLANDDGVYPKIDRPRRAEFLPWFVTIQAIAERRGIPRPQLEFGLNLTSPQHSPILLDNLARSAGGRAPEARAAFKTTADRDYQALLQALRDGAQTLRQRPRVEMPGGQALPQERNFGKVF